MHIVHIKEPYGSLAEAEHDMAGIALLAFLFEVMLGDTSTSLKISRYRTASDVPTVLRAGSSGRSSSFGRHHRCFGTSAEQRYGCGDAPDLKCSPDLRGHFPLLCAGSSTVIPNFRLSDLVPSARDLHSYYRYVGSMTTPGCEQAVAWTVFHRTLSISSRQVRDHVWEGQSTIRHGMLALH